MSNLTLMFSIFSFAFILFLFIVTFYEVYITGYLTEGVDTPPKYEAMEKKYSNFGFNNYFDNLFLLPSIDEDEEFEDEEDRHDMYEKGGDDYSFIFGVSNAYGLEYKYDFVVCYHEPTKTNITYPKGTICGKEARDQDAEYDYEEDEDNGTKITEDEEEKEKQKDRNNEIKVDDESEGNKYSIQICPPKCPKDYEVDEDEEKEEDEDEEKEEDDEDE